MLRAAATVLLLIGNLALIGTPIFLGGLLKRLLPSGRLRAKFTIRLANLAKRWVANNDRIFDTMLPTKWEVSGVETGSHDGRYLMVSNHASWVDIIAIFRAFHDDYPFIRFFMKSQLLWFPILGQACWALDFPFMKRHSPDFVAKHPEKRGEDLETTRKACRKYRHIPVAILNFLEGTRFSETKRRAEGSPYRHLLRPRSGGISFVLASMGEQLDAIYDVTLAYPGREVNMIDFLLGRTPRVVVHVRRVEVPQEFFDAAVTERGEVRDRFKLWLEQLWREKDELLERLDPDVSRAA